jgi:hypothetical protein
MLLDGSHEAEGHPVWRARMRPHEFCRLSILRAPSDKRNLFSPPDPPAPLVRRYKRSSPLGSQFSAHAFDFGFNLLAWDAFPLLELIETGLDLLAV